MKVYLLWRQVLYVEVLQHDLSSVHFVDKPRKNICVRNTITLITFLPDTPRDILRT